MRSSSRPDTGGVVLGAVAIVLAGVALGLVYNQFTPVPLPILVQVNGEQLPLPPGITGVSLAEARRMYDAQEAPFIDARPPEAYAEEGHIPGALSIPADLFETRYLDYMERLEAAPRVVVYCDSADCGDALATVARLKEAYPGRIELFVGGWLEWTAAKYPTRTGEAP